MIKAAIMGFGTVGSGVYEVLHMNRDAIASRVGNPIEVRYILDIRDFSDRPDAHLFTKDFNVILEDPEVRIVAETMGGVTPAYEFTKKLLLAGKHVATSNKELVAKHGTELLQIAREKHVNYMFEASVGGGIPVIRPMSKCMAANEITEIMGILNGTTNYILDQMIRLGTSFSDALKDAQDKGYAERNPEADIEGHDACRKIAILASLACGKGVDSEKIPTEGITNIDLNDVVYAEKLSSVIKLIGYASLNHGKVFARVSPMLIKKESPLSHVDGVMNAILLKGNAVGEAMFYGPGAGKLPTASAVAADMVDSAKHLDKNVPMGWKEGEPYIMIPQSEVVTRYFIRVRDKESVLAEFRDAQPVRVIEGEVGAVLPAMTEGEYAEKFSRVNGIIKKIRME